MGRALSVIGVPTSAANFSAALEGLTALNEQLLRAAPETPPLYAAGVRYTKRASDKWRNVLDVCNGGGGYDAGLGDCEALAPWRAAELRVTGEDPGAAVLCYRTGPKKFHAIVLRGDGQIEDPSVLLGMQAPRGLVESYQAWNNAILTSQMGMLDGGDGDAAVMGYGGEDAACVGIGPDVEDGADMITFDVEELRGVDGRRGYRGHVRVPLADGRALYAQTSPSASPREAEQKGTSVIGLVGSVWDDVAALVSPFPEAAAALRLARNQHVQNVAKSAYKAARGKHGSQQPQQAPSAGGQVFRMQRESAAGGAPQPTAGNWMPPMGAPTGADLSDPAYYADMSDGPMGADQWNDVQQPQGGGAFRNDDVYAELMAARGQDEADSGIYGFGPTPTEQSCLDEINGFLAAGSRPSTVGATAFRQLGGAGFRSVAPTTRPTATTSPSSPSGSLPAGFRQGVSVPGGAVPAAPGAPAGAGPAYSGMIYSPATNSWVPAGTNLRGYGATPYGAAPPPSGYGYYPGGYYPGGGVSSTGVPYGAAAAYGGGGGGGGGYAASSSYDDYGSGAATVDPDAFYGSNPSGLSPEDKADLLDAYGSGE